MKKGRSVVNNQSDVSSYYIDLGGKTWMIQRHLSRCSLDHLRSKRGRKQGKRQGDGSDHAQNARRWLERLTLIIWKRTDAEKGKVPVLIIGQATEIYISYMVALLQWIWMQDDCVVLDQLKHILTLWPPGV